MDLLSGMQAAILNATQMETLKDAEKKLNGGGANGEIYLLAVRKQG